jgi:hypothetical protein
MVMVVGTSDKFLQLRLNVLIVPDTPHWTPYSRRPSNFVFRADKSYVEEDTERKAGVAAINTIVR